MKRVHFNRLPIPSWIVRGDDRFLDALIASRGQSEEALEGLVRRTLREERIRRIVTPWIDLLGRPFRFLWRSTYGSYRRSRPQVHGGSAQAAGGGTGALSIPTTVPTNPSTPIPFEDAGIRAGEVTAFRCWHRHDDGFLYSVAMPNFRWEPGQVMEGLPVLPSEGIHAFKMKGDALRHYEKRGGGNVTVVHGTVELWGEVYEHQIGYRASKARIASIDDSPYYDAAAIRQTYGLK